MAMTIEERWKAHTEARIAERQAAYDYGVWYMDGVEGPRCKRVQEIATRNADKTARALALAATDEEWEAAKQDLVWTQAKIPSAASIALRKRIEHLGRADAT